MEPIRKLKSYKVFHLITDTTSSVPEKVFLVEEELKAIEYALGKAAMLGLVGPKQALRQAVLNIERGLTGSDSVVDLELAPSQKAAIFLVQVVGAQSAEPICLLLFVTSDGFYYQKPLDTRSIYYLILRFLGDMCSNILLVYDKQIEQNFQPEGSRYTISNNQVISMIMTNRSSRDILMKNYEFDTKQLIECDPDYLSKINLKDICHNTFITYTNKILSSMYQKKYQEVLNKAIVECWKQVFVKAEKNPENILCYINKPSTGQNISLIHILFHEKQHIENLIRKIGEKYLSQAQYTYGKRSSWSSTITKPLYDLVASHETFYCQLYYRFISKAKLDPSHGSYSVEQLHYLYSDVSYCLVNEIEPDQKKQAYYVKMFWTVAEDLSKEIFDKIEEQVFNYYSLMRKHFKKQKKTEQELIQISIYNCEIIKSKEGIIKNTILNESFKYCFKEQMSIQKLNLNKLSDIESISVFELKNKAHKLLWIQMSPTASCCYAKLVVLTGDNVRILKTIPKNHKEKTIIHFTFFSENQKAYIVNSTTKQLFHFKIDEMQRVVDEKRIEIQLRNRKIFCLDFSIFPQTLFYLTQERNIIYTYKLQEKCEGEICNSMIGPDRKTIKYLKLDDKPYEYLKTFNQDIFLILGTKQQIDIIEPSTNGRPHIRFTIKLNYLSFRGLSVFADRINEYLIVHDAKESSVYAFTNMSARNILEEQARQQVVRQGNPIMDIFREAVDKFGDYPSSMQLIHLTELEPASIESYASELSLQGHIHTILKPNELQQSLQQKLRILTKQALMEIILTRIPIQICTIQEGNLETLVAGRRERLGQGRSMSIAQRSRMLNFGIIEQIMTREADKRVIVVSVMGAQSTGKSYLMNRLFGTRFTVASSRTTDGLWISLVEGKQFNYLLIDCQGLFSLERSPKEEEKLIKVLASLSDYSIMNQNMSLTSRTFSELMERISATVTDSIDHMNNLFNGELFVVVRDVESNRGHQVLAEFKRCFEVSERNNANVFIKKLFGGRVNLYSVSNFLLPQFKNDIQNIRKHIDRKGPERPLRTAQDILNSLKVVMTQLMCDDTEEYGNNLEDFKLETVKDEVMQLWRKGSEQNGKFIGTVKGIEIYLHQKDVSLAEQSNLVEEEGKNDLTPFFQLLHSNIPKDKISTVDFNKIYKEFNNFIVNFFQQRKKLVQKLIALKIGGELANISPQKKKSFESKLTTSIADHMSQLRLCLQSCYDCKLICISKFGHRSNIEKQRQNARVAKLEIQKTIVDNQPTEKEKELMSKGIQKAQSDQKQKLEIYGREMDQLQRQQSLTKQLHKVEADIKESMEKKLELEQNISLYNRQKVLQAKNQINQSLTQYLNTQKQQQGFPLIQASQTLKQIPSTFKDEEEVRTEEKIIAQYFEKIHVAISQACTQIKNIREEISSQMNKINVTNTKLEDQIQQKEKIIKNNYDSIQHLSSQEELLRLENDKLQTISSQSSKNIQSLKDFFQRIQVLIKQKEPFINSEKYSKTILREEFIRIESEIKHLHDLIRRSSDNVIQKFKNQALRMFEIVEEIQRLKPNEQDIEVEKDFQCYLKRLQSQLKESSQSLEGKSLSINDLKSELRKRFDLWDKKLKNAKQKDKQETFEQKVLIYRKHLQELQIQIERNQSIVLRKQKQLQLKKRKQIQYSKLIEQFPEHAEAVSIISHLHLCGINLSNPQEVTITQFIKQNPLYSSSKNLLYEVNVFDRSKYYQQISELKERFQTIQLQWENNEDPQKGVSLEKQRQQLAALLQTEQIKIKFINFMVKTAVASSQQNFKADSLNHIYELYQQEQNKKLSIKELKKIQIKNHKLMEASLNKIQDELSKLQNQYDSTEDTQRANEIQKRQNELEKQKEILGQQLIFIKFAKQKLLRLAQDSLKQFVDQHQDKEYMNSLKLQFIEDLFQERLTSSQIKPQLLQEYNQEFRIFRCQNLSQKSSSDPIFKPMMQKYPRSGDLIPILEKLFKQLHHSQNSLNNLLLQKLNNILQNGNISNVQKQLLDVILKDAEQKFWKNKKQLEKQLRQKETSYQNMKYELKEFDLMVQQMNKLEKQRQKYQKEIETEIKIQKQTETKLTELKESLLATSSKLQVTKSNILNLQNLTKQLQISKIKNNYQFENLSHKKQFCKKLLEFRIFSLPSYKVEIELFVTEQISNIKIKSDLEQQSEKYNKLLQIEKNCKEQISEILQRLNGRKADDINKDIANSKQQLSEIIILKDKIKENQTLKLKLEEIKGKLEILDKKTNQLCSCLTNHKCSEKCDAQCADQLCEKFAGHSGSHLCNKQNHTCSQKCQIQERCEKPCTQIFGHDGAKKHNCHSEHQCSQNCSYCQQKCTLSQFQQHEIHICDKQKKCMYKCLLCEKQCASKNHDHDKNAEIVQIRLKENPEELLKRTLHLCSDEHNCNEKCTNEGVCKFQYDPETKIWERKDCSQQYTYVKQSILRDSCKIKIPPGRYKHDQPCSCLKKGHFCTEKCPDCKSICNKQIGHKGEHTTQHRNQQSLIYAAEDKQAQILVKGSEDKQKKLKEFIFVVGDLSTPTTCVDSCKNKDRAHYHLMQCKGGDQCGEKKYKQRLSVKHSPLVYHPYPQKRYDMYLCSEYWNVWNFEMPCPGLRDHFSLCNFMCSNPHDGDPNKKEFCTGVAWHSFSKSRADHQFKCDNIHKNNGFANLQICFLIDCTGSMERFITESKKTVETIIKQTTTKYPKLEIKFSIVGYRDHPMKISPIFIAQKKAVSTKLNSLVSLSSVPAFAKITLTEKQYLNALMGLEKKYEEKKKKGEDYRAGWKDIEKFILENHHPFVLEIQSSDDILDTHQKLKLRGHPVINLLKFLALMEGKMIDFGIQQPSQTTKASLVQHLIEDLLRKQKDIESQQSKAEEQILTKLDFTSGDKAIKFLQDVKADGGGDTPEAVLDGMLQVTTLHWSKDKSVLKYVFHIFDAVPHGRIYDTDNGDKFPDGCPCNLTHEVVIKKLNQLNLNYVVYPLTENVNTSIKLFQQSGLKLKVKKIDKDEPEDMKLETVNILCEQLQQTNVAVRVD